MAALVEPNAALENQYAPEWFIILEQSSRDNLMEMITQAVGNYGSLSPDAIEDVITKFDGSVDENKVREIHRYFASFEGVYTIGDALNGGGYGTVYTCRHRESEEDFAVKRINKARYLETVGWNATSEAQLNAHGVTRGTRDWHLRRLGEEVALMRNLTTAGPHRNIVRYIASFETDESLDIVMELLDDGDLFGRVNRDLYTEDQAKPIFKQLCETVAFLHSQGPHPIIHRDIKPENIMILNPPDESTGAKIKLIDFGLAKRLAPGVNTRIGDGNMFMAPELGDLHTTAVSHDGDFNPLYGPPVDCYSLGATLLRMLSASGIPRPTSVSDITVDRLRSTLSHDVKELIIALMRFDPSARLTAEQALDHPWLSGVED